MIVKNKIWQQERVYNYLCLDVCSICEQESLCMWNVAKRILNAYYYKHEFLFTRVCIQVVCVQRYCKYVGSNENVIMCGMIRGKVCEWNLLW